MRATLATALYWITPEWVLRALDKIPVAVTTRSRCRATELNAFQLGRDYERGLMAERQQVKTP